MFFGRTSFSKGLDILVPATALFQKKFADFKLRLVISRHPKHLVDKVLDSLVQYHIASKTEVFHDIPQEQLQELIASSGAVIIPSYSEGFCFAAVETMAIGTPIISSGRGALKEVVHGTYIQMDAFTPEALCSAMVKAIKGQWAYKESHKYELENTIRQYMGLYHLSG